MIKVRQYRPEDRDALVKLWQTVFPDDPPHNAPEKIIDEKLLVDDLIFVAYHDAAMVGACMAGYDGHRGWLYAVAVLASCRRQGVGEHMIKHILEHLKQLGCGKVNLQIRADNTEVEGFYRSLGFDVEERMSMGLRMT